MTNKSNRVLYTGSTVDLIIRADQHKTKYYPKSYTAKYNINKLVLYEYFHFIDEAIARERQIKKMSRQKKISLVGRSNPECPPDYSGREGLNRITRMIKVRDSYGTQTHRPEESASELNDLFLSYKLIFLCNKDAFTTHICHNV